MTQQTKNSSSLISIFVLGLVFCSLVFIPAVLDFYLSPRLISLSALLLIVIYLMLKYKTKIIFNINVAFIFYTLYVIWCFASSAWAINKAEALFENAKLSIGLFVFIISVYLLSIDIDTFLTWILKASIIIVCCIFGVIILQLFTLNDLSKPSLYQLTGLNGHKNLVSSFLFLNLFFLLQGYITKTSSLKKASLIAMLMSFVMLVLLRTKAVWLGLSIATLIYLIQNAHNKFGTLLLKKHLRKIYMVILFVLFNSFFLFAFEITINKGLSNSQNKSEQFESKQSSLVDNERLTVWKKTYHTIQKHLFFGVGAGNWQIVFPDASLTGLWRAEDLNVTFQRPHNDFLWILSENGLLGLNLYAAFIFLLIYYYLQSNYYKQNKKKVVALIPLAFLIGYLTISFFDFPKERIEHIIWLNIFFAVLYHQGIVVASNLKYKKLEVQKFHLRIVMVIVSICCVIAFLRLNGEYNTRKMYDAKNRTAIDDVISLGKKALNTCYNVDPTSVPIAWYIGNAYSNKKDYLVAHAYFLDAFKQNPFNRNVINDLGSSYILNGETNLGVACYKESSRISPRFDDPKLNLAAVLLNQNKLIEAKNCLDSILHDSERRTNYYEILKIKQELKP